MINSAIKDSATGNQLSISKRGDITVEMRQYPANGAETSVITFRQFFTDTGFEGGDEDMRVNGSLNPQFFSVKSDDKNDIYIKKIFIVIADAGAVLNEFGNISALPVGVDLDFVTSALGPQAIQRGMKTNFDFLTLSNGQPAFGNGNSAFTANNVEGASEAFLFSLDIGEVFGIPFGLRLTKGTEDRIQFTINDNVSGVDRFDAVAFGSKVIL